MNLDRNSFFARFYCKAYTKIEPPTNFCKYFWGLVWVLLWLPLTFWTYLPICDCNRHIDRIKSGFCAILVLFGSGTIGGTLATQWFNQGGGWAFVWGIPIGLSLIGACFLAILLIFFVGSGIAWLFKKIFTKGKDKAPNILVEAYKSFKGKYCPTIEWIDKDDQ